MGILHCTPVRWFQVAFLGCVSALAGAEPLVVDYDAAFVSMTAPERVTAGEVFAVRITMRNTGTKAWEGGAFRLCSTNPRSNSTWGTDYILIAQGTIVQPGTEYVFRSYLKAPAQGQSSLQWQGKNRQEWFGQPTPARTIEVVPRPAQPNRAAETGQRTNGKTVLKFSDFGYAGSFKPPKTVKGARGAFSESGLALRPGSDERNYLLINYTHPTQVLFEVDIPPLLRIEEGGHAGLNTAQVRRVWGTLKIPVPGGDAISPNGGFVWNEKTRTLLWTWYHGYKTGEAPAVLGASKLPEEGEPSSSGPWRIVAPDGLYKSYWGGVIGLPARFAEQYTGGRTLALGFGGYYSICASASRGPALGVIPEPESGQGSVVVTPLLYYPHQSPAPRDGDYFNANCGFWNEQPDDPEHGKWTYDDWARAGVFIDTPSGQAYIAFVRLGTGRLGYDFGAITSAGAAQYWYIYNSGELGEAAAGRKDPCQITPASMTKVIYPLGRNVTGACLDSTARLLYLCVSAAYPDGRENYPIIHAYRLQ